MLEEHGVKYAYREYTQDPLTESELRTLFRKLRMSPAELLRSRDKAFKELGLSGEESDDELFAHMAEHPTLLQRPIAVVGRKAVVGRPVENLRELFDG